jgi:uncharacterized protein
MSDCSQFIFSPENFSGTVRLFPLPNLVLFPHVVQPLHIFEPRYCEMLLESLQTDRLIGTATLVAGWESDYEGRPPISPAACLGRVMVHHALSDGSHNVLLAGLARIEVVRELATPASFRRAEALLLEDRCPAEDASRAGELLKQIRGVLTGILPLVRDGQQQLDELIRQEIPLGTLTDLIAYLLDVDLAEKLVLLGENNVICRAEIVIRLLANLNADCRPSGRGDLPFPPLPSRN